MSVEERYRKWLASRPPVVQALAEEFPAGSVFKREGFPDYYLLGWTENDLLIVSKIDPAMDYDGARACQEYMHAHHYRQ
jgi:hypothetical protein